MNIKTSDTLVKFNYHNALNGLADYISVLQSDSIKASVLAETHCKLVMAGIRMVEFVRDISAIGRKHPATIENGCNLHTARFQYLELK